MLSKLLVVLLVIPVALGFCPKLLNNQTACSCESTVEGPVIKCTGTEGLIIIDKLKASHMEIKEFALENANIIQIGPRAFKNLRIKKLNLDKNRIQNIHEHAFLGLENVMQELSISENSLKEIPTKALAGLKVLNILSLKCNKIGNITKNAFVNMTSLIDVNLACNEICDVAEDAFQDVQLSLQNLIFDNNCMKQFPRLAVQNMKNLIALHVKYNKLNSLGENDLTNLTSLSMLSLNGNNITDIKGGALLNTPNLRYLYLNENRIHTFDNGVMGQFKQVQVIDLSYNNISEVTKDMFDGLESIQHLNLDSNRIRSVAPGAFSGTPLLLLWLPNNCLTEVTQQTFQGAPFLRMVSLSNNNIRSIQELSFGHLANLHTLDLAGNKIMSLQNKSLSGAENLAVRLQENPMVCSQNGFHVLNAGEAINLTTEENKICKRNWQKETDDMCPKFSSRPVTSVCCSSVAPQVALTTAEPAPVTKVIQINTEDQDSESEYIDEDRTDIDRENGTLVEETTLASLLATTKTVTPTVANRKVNMERFWRLSKGPSGKSPFSRHQQGSKPKYLQTTTTEASSLEDEEDSDKADYSEEETEDSERGKNTADSITANKTAENMLELPARLRERQRMFSSKLPWISQKSKAEIVEEEFNEDDATETVSVADTRV